MLGMKVPEEITKLEAVWTPYFKGYTKEREVIWAENTPEEAKEARKKSVKMYNDLVGLSQ